jgi:hypothetical protein
VIVTVASPSPPTAVGVPGTPGTANAGLTAGDGADGADVPPALRAVEVNVYAVPLFRPVTTHDVAGTVTVHVAQPGDALTTYDVGAPPVDGGVIVTVARPSPATTVGAPGTPAGATGTGPEDTNR